MNASNTPLLSIPVTIGSSSIATKKNMGSSKPNRTKKTLTLIQKPLPTLKLNPVARVFEQLHSTTTTDQLKNYEAQLLVLANEKTFYPSLWNALAQGSAHSQSLATMVLLRSGEKARTWISIQLQDADSMALISDRWILDFLKHQFSL